MIDHSTVIGLSIFYGALCVPLGIGTILVHAGNQETEHEWRRYEHTIAQALREENRLRRREGRG